MRRPRGAGARRSERKEELERKKERKIVAAQNAELESQSVNVNVRVCRPVIQG